MQKTARIDFAQLLRELDERGVSPVAVADRLGIGRSTPYRWLDGSEPLHSHGAAVLLLHAEVVGIRHGEIIEVDYQPAKAGASGHSNAVAVPAVGALSTHDLDRAETKAREEVDYPTKLESHRTAQRRSK